jgi:hypothetical protein
VKYARRIKFLLLWTLFFINTPLHASMTYEGLLTTAADVPISNTNVNFKLELLNDALTCVLYEETHTSVPTNGDGYFSLRLGTGSTTSGSVNFTAVFSNYSSMTSTISSSCTYTPSPSDTRKLRVNVDAGGGYEVLGTVSLGKVPSATHAEYLAGLTTTNFFRVAAADSAPLLTSADVSTFSSLIAGTSPLYAKMNAGNGSASLPNLSVPPSSPQAGNIWFDSSTNVLKYYNGATTISLDGTVANGLTNSTSFSGDVSGLYNALVVNRIAGVPLSFSGLTSGDLLQHNGSGFTNRSLPTCSAGQFLTFTGASFVCSANAAITSADVSAALGFVPLRPTNNLSDVTSIEATRANLDLGTGSLPTFTGLVLSGVTGNTLVKANGSGVISNATSADITTLLGYIPVNSASAVTSVAGRTGAVTLTSADITIALGFTPVNPANNLSDLSSSDLARTTLGLGAAQSPVFATVTLNNLTASKLVATNGTKQLVSATSSDVTSLLGTSFIEGVSTPRIINGTWAGPPPGATLSGAGALLATNDTKQLFQSDGTDWKQIIPRFADGTAGAPGISFQDAGTTGLFRTGPGGLAVSIGGTERVNINNNGNVGIATSSPDSKLSVNGSLRATVMSSSHYDAGGSNVIDFSLGNHITSSASCSGAAFALSNIRVGGSYKLFLTSTDALTCSFDATVAGVDSVTVNYKFSPANGNKEPYATVYEFLRFGNEILVRWNKFVP